MGSLHLLMSHVLPGQEWHPQCFHHSDRWIKGMLRVSLLPGSQGMRISGTPGQANLCEVLKAGTLAFLHPFTRTTLRISTESGLGRFSLAVSMHRPWSKRSWLMLVVLPVKRREEKRTHQ